MTKRKRKLTAAEKAEKKQRQKEYMTIFVKGKQKRVKRPQTIDGNGQQNHTNYRIDGWNWKASSS